MRVTVAVAEWPHFQRWSTSIHSIRTRVRQAPPTRGATVAVAEGAHFRCMSPLFSRTISKRIRIGLYPRLLKCEENCNSFVTLEEFTHGITVIELIVYVFICISAAIESYSVVSLL